MLLQTHYKTSPEYVEQVVNDFRTKGKHTLNLPTQDPFYDPWKIKSEFTDTAWEKILGSLPSNIGEARVIVMESPSCYTRHADIDDRYHLTLNGDEDYLIDLESKKMYPLVIDGYWYTMNAGRLHTAICIGEEVRIQLVVRHLLTRNKLRNPVSVVIRAGGQNPRYNFDNNVSLWLNMANKKKIITNFSKTKNEVFLDIEHSKIQELKKILPDKFELEII